jgi:hypothetical protein
MVFWPRSLGENLPSLVKARPWRPPKSPGRLLAYLEAQYPKPQTADPLDPWPGIEILAFGLYSDLILLTVEIFLVNRSLFKGTLIQCFLT